MTDNKEVKLADATEEQCMTALKTANDQFRQNQNIYTQLKSTVDNGNSTLLRLTNEKSNAETAMTNMINAFKDLEAKEESKNQESDEAKQMNAIKSEHENISKAREQILSQLDGNRCVQIDRQNESLKVLEQQNSLLHRTNAILQRIIQLRTPEKKSESDLPEITEVEETQESLD